MLMLDCDAEGDNGVKQTLYELVQHCDVRVPWSEKSHGGRFNGRQPENLMPADVEALFVPREPERGPDCRVQH